MHFSTSDNGTAMRRSMRTRRTTSPTKRRRNPPTVRLLMLSTSNVFPRLLKCLTPLSFRAGSLLPRRGRPRLLWLVYWRTSSSVNHLTLKWHPKPSIDKEGQLLFVCSFEVLCLLKCVMVWGHCKKISKHLYHGIPANAVPR